MRVQAAYNLGKKDARAGAAYANPYDCYSSEWIEYRRGYFYNRSPFILPSQ